MKVTSAVINPDFHHKTMTIQVKIRLSVECNWQFMLYNI